MCLNHMQGNHTQAKIETTPAVSCIALKLSYESIQQKYEQLVAMYVDENWIELNNVLLPKLFRVACQYCYT